MITKAIVKDKKVFIEIKENKEGKEEYVEVPDCIIFGNGGDSEGFMIMDNDKWYYLPYITNDIKTILDDIVEALRKVASSVTNSMSTSPGSPIQTTIQSDLQPVISKIEDFKNKLV
jgi:hypothetical protein